MRIVFRGSKQLCSPFCQPVKTVGSLPFRICNKTQQLWNGRNCVVGVLAKQRNLSPNRRSWSSSKLRRRNSLFLKRIPRYISWIYIKFSVMNCYYDIKHFGNNGKSAGAASRYNRYHRSTSALSGYGIHDFAIARKRRHAVVKLSAAAVKKSDKRGALIVRSVYNWNYFFGRNSRHRSVTIRSVLSKCIYKSLFYSPITCYSVA